MRGAWLACVLAIHLTVASGSHESPPRPGPYPLVQHRNVNTDGVRYGRRHASRHRIRGLLFAPQSGRYLSGQYRNVTDGVNDGRHRASQRKSANQASDHDLSGQYLNETDGNQYNVNDVPDGVNDVRQYRKVTPGVEVNVANGGSKTVTSRHPTVTDGVNGKPRRDPTDVTSHEPNVTDVTRRHPTVNGVNRRRKRSVVQLASMLRCVTGCNPLAYKGYGCYCGYRGSGLPVDEIDRCCLEHDWCYTHIACPSLLVYFVPYRWTCAAPGYPQCEIAPGSGLPAECTLQLCECDRQFAKCVRNFPCPKYKANCQSQSYLTNVIMGGK